MKTSAQITNISNGYVSGTNQYNSEEFGISGNSPTFRDFEQEETKSNEKQMQNNYSQSTDEHWKEDGPSKEFKLLESMMSEQIMGYDVRDRSQNKQSERATKCLVETYGVGLCFEEFLVDSIPCIVSADQTKLIAFLNDIDSKVLTKSTLFNLINTAEQVSPACQKLIFITKRNSSSYRNFQKTFDIIDAVRMKKSDIQSEQLISNQYPEDNSMILKTYAFYEMDI